MSTKNNTLKVAALADIHVAEIHDGRYKEIFTDVSENADILVLSGDLTNTGIAKEAENLAEDLRSCRVPVVAVLGNHDYHHGQQDEIKQVLKQAGVNFLDEGHFIYKDVGFAGVKGFGGGFGTTMLAPFGEDMMKAFVREAVEEALVLENSLREIPCSKKVVALHYAPIWETLVGEPKEIHPFLGCARFAETAERYEATAIVHGHAHYGVLSGQTEKGVPVYNCTVEVLKANNLQYLILEI